MLQRKNNIFNVLRGSNYFSRLMNSGQMRKRGLYTIPKRFYSQKTRRELLKTELIPDRKYKKQEGMVKAEF